MVSKVGLAIAMASGLTVQMKASTFGTVAGARGVLHTDPDSHDPAAAYPLVSEDDAKRLEASGLAERFDGDVPDSEELVKKAQAKLDDDYQRRVKLAQQNNQPEPAPAFRLQPIASGDYVDEAAANKVGEKDSLKADQSVNQTTGLDTRNTTHYSAGPNEAGLQGDDAERVATATLAGESPDAAPGSEGTTSARRSGGRSKPAE